MGTRGRVFSTFVGCCVWILHGLGAAAAVPVTTEGLFAAGTASPITAESEGPHALVMGTVETSTAASDAEIAESILAGSLSSPSFPPGAESDTLVTAVSEYGSTVPILTNATKPLNTSQDIERGSAAPAAATTAAAISTQHPAVTPEAELGITGAAPEAPLGTTHLFAGEEEDILAAMTREGAGDVDLTTGAVSLPITPPPATTWGAQPAAGSPVGATVTTLLSQGLTTAMGAAEEGVTLPVDIQSEASASSSSPSPGIGELFTTQQDGTVNGAVGIAPEPVGEVAPAAEERPLTLVPGDTGDAVNGEFSTAGSSHLPLESPMVLGTVGDPGEPSLHPGQAVLSPTSSLARASDGDGDGQGTPGLSSEAPGSALSPAASGGPAVPDMTEDTATSLLAPLVPTDAQSDMNPPIPATAVPTGDMGAVGLAKPSLQPSPWQTLTGEQPPLVADSLPSPTDMSSAPAAAYQPLGADYRPAGAGAGTLPAVDNGAETPASPDLGAAQGAPVSPSLGESQPGGMAVGAPQGDNGPGTGVSSASDAPNSAPFVPDGLAWPAAGVQGQGAEGAGDVAQTGGPGGGGPYAGTQSDTSPSAFSAQQDPAGTGDLLAGETGALTNAELSPPSALGDGAGAGAEAAAVLGQASSPGPAPPGSAGLEPNLLGAGGPGNLPGESASAPGAAYPLPGAVSGPVFGAETPGSLDLGAAQGAPVSPSLGESQPGGMAVGAPQGDDGPGTGVSSASDAPNSAPFVPDGLAWPAAGVQGQGAEGAGTQSDTSSSAFSAQQDPAGTGDLLAGETGALTNAELSPPSALGDGAGAGAEAAAVLGQASSPGPAPPGSAGLEPNLLGAGGPGNLPGESASAPGAAYPLPGAVSGPVSGAETPGSLDLGAAQGAPMSPSLRESQPGGMAVGAPQGDDGPGTGVSSASDAPNSAPFVPDGLAWPAAGVQGQGAEGAGTQSDTSSSAFSAQQDPAGTGDLLAGETGALTNAELSPPSALGDGAGAEAAAVLGQAFPPGPAPPGSAGLEANFLGAGGPGNLPGESASAPGAAYPLPGAVSGPVFGAETPGSPDRGAAQGAPVSPSLGESQPGGMAAGAPQAAGLPGVNGPGTGFTSAWDAPSSAAYGPAGPPSPALGDQLGTQLGLPAAEGHGAGMVEQAVGGAGGGTGFEPPVISAAGSGMAAGMDQLPSAGSSSGPASPSGAVAAPSVSDPANLSALGGDGVAPGALQPSLGAGPGVPLAAREGTGEAAGDGESPGQSQAPTGKGPAGSGALDGETGAVLQSASSSPYKEVSSSPRGAANGANTPGAGGASGGLSTGLEAAGPKERPVSAPGIQNGADLGLSDAKLSQVNVVELPAAASANGTSTSGASLGESAGDIIQIASGALAPSALSSPQEMQPLLPVASDGSGVSDGTASTLADSLLLPGHGLEPKGDTQSASRPLVPGTLGGLARDAGGAQTWSLEDESASGMPAPLGEASTHTTASLNAALALPSALQRENAAEGLSTTPGLSTSLSARESIAGYSAGEKGELGAAALGGPTLPLPPHQTGSLRAPSRDPDSAVPGEVTAMLPRAMAGRGDMAQLLPSVTGAGAGVETSSRSPLGGSPGIPDLPPTGIAAGSPGSKTPGPGPAGGSSPAALQPFLGGELTTTLANGAHAASGSSLPAAFSGQGGARGGSPATARPAISCSPATASPAPPAPFPGGREVLPRPGAATVTSRASSPVFPALPGGPVAAPTPLPGPTVAAVPLYGYGARENDREYVERRVDFTSPLFKPETGFPFGKSLRDSLYFTDNGQIIFPASDNSIFTYPNPPPSGFNGHEDVPMIAVFWDNADFSRGVGTTFYQEFPTLNTAKPPFVRDVEAKVRRYLRSSYSAAWTLKITWEKAPAYAARTDTRRTITYQAILTTDGFRSYVLMLYQEGGMQWDYTRLSATNVLIGYTSGDGFYRNDDLIQRPPAAKYRPDQFRGYNTDLRGLWIYKLESRVRVNYRLKCLAWMGRQQEPGAWTQGLPTCPCSLQQGQQDPRFKSSRGGWWAARVSMLHSASPNQHGAGVRCLYDSQSQLIEGRQERYWRSSRQASLYRDQELKLYDWCCNQAGSAHLCARYSEKRPKIGCDGYQSPDTAGSSEEEESDSEDQRDGDDE